MRRRRRLRNTYFCKRVGIRARCLKRSVQYTYQELMAYKDSTSNCFIDEELRTHKSMIVDLLDAMHNDTEVNMATLTDDPRSKTKIRLEALSNRCDIHCEGELHKAKVYSPPLIRLVLQQFTLPLDKFMHQMASVVSLAFYCIQLHSSSQPSWYIFRKFNLSACAACSFILLSLCNPA